MKIVRFLVVSVILAACFLLSSCSGCSKEKFSCLNCPIGTTCDIEKKMCIEEISNNENGDDSTESWTDGDCNPGEIQVCDYNGPDGTEGVGPCRAPIRICKEDGTWGICEDGYEPVHERGEELCANGIDDDCNGVVDDGVDIDGDGYGECADCCESEFVCKGFDPSMIHPGAYEMIGDEIDNNCDGQIDEPTSCDAEEEPLAVGDYKGNAVKLARAIGICGDQLVSAEISLAGKPVVEHIADDFCVSEIINNPDILESRKMDELEKHKFDRMSRGMPYYNDEYQTFAAEPGFGTKIVPLEGSKIAILSTGHWKNPTKDVDCATLEQGDMKTASTVPEDWINMMPDCTIPKSPSCGGTVVEDGLKNQCDGKDIPSVQDPVMLTLKVKVPENARAFEFNLFFFSKEYPGTVCDDRKFNDFFVALLDSEYNENPDDEFRNPYDKNLAKDEKGNFVGVDLAPDGLFQVCDPDDEKSEYASSCVQGKELLLGTHFKGGTGWLTTRGNVIEGEIITLRFAIWEYGTVTYGPDHSFDSTVLLDGFRWLPKPAKAGTSGRQ
ncbi:hypothetical protein J6Z19_00850 [bacterium]|nr:hypothetical protein [bacterium]